MKALSWKKLGQVFCPDNHHDWMVTHAANPVPFMLDNGLVRVFFTCRDKDSRSHIAYADMDFDNQFTIVHLSDEPVLAPGTTGLFDDSGVAMSWILPVGNRYYLYYLGWNLRVTVPWLNTIGLAVAESIDGPFIKHSRVPLLDRSEEDPFTISYPCVLFDKGQYRMWYGSNLSWGKEQHEMAHVIKYAESPDGIHWTRTNQVHIPFIHPGEYALSKPCVVKFGDGYRMWYSYRASEKGPNYRIGTAFSADGNAWIRQDEEVGIDVSADGWDSTSIEYPNVFRYKDEWYMLYNGNDYGRTGFGIAILEK